MDSQMMESGIHDASPALPRYDGPEAWRGEDMALRRDEWIRPWHSSEIAEIEAAVAAVSAQGLEILQVGRDEFPLPNLAPVLEAIRREVLHGRGFVLLRGLPVDRWTLREAAIAYWGLGTHLGEACSQNALGHVLGHVKDLGRDYYDPLARGYQTSARLPYHTDSGDIVGLLCWRAGRTGGLSSIVSSTSVFNEFAALRPDMARELMKPFCRTRWGETDKSRRPWIELPVFMPMKGRMIANYVRSAINKGQLLDGVPRLNATQIEALDLMDRVMQDPALCLDMEFRPGDIQLLCNHSVFHGRSAYEDWPEPERRRHLLRLWLACADGPELPPVFVDNYQEVSANGRPNGIHIPGVSLVAPLEAA